MAYEGEGTYFLDKLRAGVWRLEVYPDAVPVRDPFEPPSPDKIVTRAISRAWPMTLALPDLGRTFTVQPVTAGNPRTEQAADGRFTVTPGVYVLSSGRPGRCRHAAGDTWGTSASREYHAPPPDTLPLSVTPLAPPAILAGRDAELRARVVDGTPPDSAVLFIRPQAAALYQRLHDASRGGLRVCRHRSGSEPCERGRTSS